MLKFALHLSFSWTAISKAAGGNIVFEAAKMESRVFEAQSAFLVPGVEAEGLSTELLSLEAGK